MRDMSPLTPFLIRILIMTRENARSIWKCRRCRTPQQVTMFCRLSLVATYFLFVIVEVFAQVEVRIRLQHNLGDGFVDAGWITGTVDDQVLLIACVLFIIGKVH